MMKREVILYVAVSVDGYIADEKGGVGWLVSLPAVPPEQQSDLQPGQDYNRFIQGVDVILMGMNTYRQIATELSPEVWPYSDQECFIFTNHPMEDSAGIKFVSGDAAGLIQSLRDKEGRNIWICGGADLANQLIQAGQIDRYHLTVIPQMLGRGIRLFREKEASSKLRLDHISSAGGMVTMIYSKEEN